MIDKKFCAKLLATFQRKDADRQESLSCPRLLGGCGKRAALFSVSKEGLTMGQFCSHCGWESESLRGYVKMPSTKPTKPAKRTNSRSTPIAKKSRKP